MDEGSMGKSKLEAFSDGVINIMVLELKVLMAKILMRLRR
jgi:uncharacterized membrane protein